MTEQKGGNRYECRTKPVLTQLAKQKGIKLSPNARKTTIIESLRSRKSHPKKA